MKIFKKLCAILLVGILALSVVGCHEKDEIAVTVDGVKFTSAYYMCALINAKSEAQSKVYENLSDKEKQEEIDYFSKKIDKKSFSDWTKDRAIQILKEIATYKNLCKDAGVELDDNTRTQTENMASYYWQNGYSQYFEPNGVSLATYTAFTIDGSYSNAYFEHLYGKGGKKEIPAEDVKAKIYDTYIIANLLNADFTEETADQKQAIKAKFEEYVKNLNAKKTTFADIYKEYNSIPESEETEETTVPKPKDEYATIIDKENSQYAEYFEEINKMTIGEAKVITKGTDDGYLLVIKQDIKADDYYLEDLDLTARHFIKNDEYQKDIQKSVDKAKADINKYAINQFKVKKIKEPSYS